VYSGANGSTPGANSSTVYNVPYFLHIMDPLTTANNTLDDGGGNVTIAGQLNVAGNLQMTDGAGTGIYPYSTGGVYFDQEYFNLHFRSGAPIANAWQVWDNAATPVSVFAVGNSAAVTTSHNTLDDESVWKYHRLGDGTVRGYDSTQYSLCSRIGHRRVTCLDYV